MRPNTPALEKGSVEPTEWTMFDTWYHSRNLCSSIKVQVIWPPTVTFWPKGKKKLRYNKKIILYFLWFFYVFGVILDNFYSCTFFDLRLRFFVIGQKKSKFSIFHDFGCPENRVKYFFSKLFMISKLLSMNLKCDRI